MVWAFGDESTVLTMGQPAAKLGHLNRVAGPLGPPLIEPCNRELRVPLSPGERRAHRQDRPNADVLKFRSLPTLAAQEGHLIVETLAGAFQGLAGRRAFPYRDLPGTVYAS